MSTRLLALLAMLSLLLSGCASQMVWYQEGKTFDECQSDYLNAKLEATKHGYVQASPFGDPIASGAAAGMEQGFREVEIIKAYMRAKGYRLIPRSEVERNGGTVHQFR